MKLRPSLRRLVASRSSAIVLGGSIAALLSQSSAQAAVKTWVGGTALFSTAANWNAGALPVTADSFTFGAAGAGGTTLTNDFTTSAFSLAGITFNAGAPAYIINASSATNTFVLTGNITNNSTNLQTLNNLFSMTAVRTFTTTAGGGNILVSGNMSGAGGGVTKAGAGTLTLSGTNTQTGATTITLGNLILTGTMSSPAASTINGGGFFQFSGASGSSTGAGAYNVNNGSLILDNTTAAGGNNNTRINNTSAIVLNGGTFLYKGADAVATNSTETVGAISGSGGSTVTVTFGGTNNVTLTAAAFNHAVGNATQLVNGLNLGRDSASTSSTGRIILTAAPTLVGTTAAIATGINTGVQNTQIVPFLLGETTATSGGLGTVTGVANTFMTYNATTGLRPLNLTDEFASNVITSGMNTYVTSAVSVAASDAINSLILNGADVSIDDGATLTNSSGAILFTSSQAIKPTAATGALTFGATEAQVSVNSGATATISAALSGSAGLTKSGAGTLVLAGDVSGLSGATNVGPGGALRVATAANIPSGTLSLVGAGGSTATLELFNDAATNYAKDIVLSGVSSGALHGITVDRAVGGSGINNAMTVGNITQPNAQIRTLTVNGANGYSLVVGNLSLSPLNGQTTTVVANVDVTLNDISNPMSGFTATNFDTVVLSGTATGSTVVGVIEDAVGGSIAAGGTTRVTKNGTGTWTLNGNNTYTGVTVLGSGSATAGGGGTLVLTGNNVGATGNVQVGNGATLRLQSASALGTTGVAGSALQLFNGSTLQLRSDSTTTFSGTNTIGGLNAATVGIDVNQLTGAGSNGILTISPGTTPVGTTVTLNITGGNGYSLAFGTLQNIITTGTNTVTLNPTTASMSLVGYNHQFAAANTVAGVLVLGGTSLANKVTGVIANQGAGSVATGTVSVTKSGASTWTLSGASTYTGATAVNGGTLALGATGTVGGSLGATAVTVSAGTLAVIPGVTTTTNNAIGSTLTINAGSAFTAADGFTNTFNVVGATNLYAGTAGIAPSYTFNLSGTNNVSDVLAIGGAASFTNAGSLLSFVPLAALTNGNTYTVATAASGLDSANAWTLASAGRTAFGNTAYTLSLANNPGSSVITVTGSGIANAYYNGAQGTTLNAVGAGPFTTNWATDITGSADAAAQPNNFTDVFFSATGATNLTVATLGQDYVFNSLNFNSAAGSVTINDTASNKITVNGGITMASGSPTSTVNVPVTLGGAQTWSNASTTGTLVVSGPVTNGSNTITSTGAGNTTISGAVGGGSGGILKTGNGTLTLGGANTYTGPTTLQGGTTVLSGSSTTSSIVISGGTGTTLRVTNAAATGTGSIALQTGATTPTVQFAIDGGGTIAIPNALAGNSGITTTIDVNNNGTGSNGVVQLTGSMETSATGNATYNITGGNGYSLRIDNLRNTGGSAGTLLLNPTTATVSIGNVTVNPVNAATTGTYVVGLGGTNTGNEVTGVISNNVGGPGLNASGPALGGVTKSNTSTWTLSGANTYTGATIVNGGTLKAGSAVAFSGIGGLTVNNTGTFDLAGFNSSFTALSSAVGSTITNSGALATLTNVSGAPALNGLITGPIAIQISNANSATNIFKLDSPNTFSGGITLTGGTGAGTRMRIWSGTAGTPGVIVNSGTAGAITSSPFGTGPITLGLNAADKGGLMANDLAPGSTILNEIIFNTALGSDNRGIRVESSATGLIFAGKITAAQANAVFTSGNAAAVSLTGKVTGAFGLETNNVNSNVVLTLNNAADDNDYAGNTIVGHSGALASTLALGRSNQIPNGLGKGDVVVNGNFNLGGFSETINGLSGAATGIVDGVSGTPTLTVGDNDATSAFAGVIKNTAGTLALAKIGTGTLTLSGVNTFTGTTTISAGTLLVSGSISGSAVSVNGGTLGGSGGTTGAVTVATGGTIAPGTSIGTLNTGALAFTGGAFGLEINTTAVTSDLANVTGNLSLLGGATLSITDFAVSGTPLSNGQVFTFIDYSGAWDGGAFAGYADDSQFTFGANEFRISYNGVDNATTAVTLEVVPEPGSAVLLLGGLAALAGIRRRRA